MLIYSKKGQIGMMEIIMVLIVIFIIVFISLFTYYKYFFKDIEKSREELSFQEQSILLSSVLAMPELQCSFNSVERNCVDTQKLSSFIMDNKKDYVGVFGFKNIKIEQVYPEINVNKECREAFNFDFGNYPNNCNFWLIYDNKPSVVKNTVIISTPVSLYFPVSSNGEVLNDYRIGKLVIESYK